MRVETKKGVTHTGIKVREGKDELDSRTAEDRILTIPTRDIDEKETLKLSLMPEGLTDPLTRAELIDLVRYLSELGKTPAYSVGQARVARRWQALEPTPEAIKILGQKGPSALMEEAPGLIWTSVYSTVGGMLPWEVLPRPQASVPAQTVAYVRTQVEVSTGGEVLLRHNAVKGLRVWIDEWSMDPSADIKTRLTPGIHTITFEVDQLGAKSKSSLRAGGCAGVQGTGSVYRREVGFGATPISRHA